MIDQKKKAEQFENLKVMLRFPFSLHVAYEKAMKDGVINWKDLPVAFDPGTKMIKAVGAFKIGLKEAKKITNENKKELVQWIAENYDIQNDKVEKKVEQALAILVDIGAFIND